MRQFLLLDLGKENPCNAVDLSFISSLLQYLLAGHFFGPDTINNMLLLNWVFALTCRDEMKQLCRFSNGCMSCRFIHFDKRCLYLSSIASLTLPFFYSHSLLFSHSASLLSSFWGGATSPLDFSWDRFFFLHHQTAAGRTSPHSVSVYFSTIWSVHILVKLVSANTFPSQNEWVSVISAAPAFNIRYAAYLQRTRTDAMPPPGATASNTFRQINTNITATYKHICIDTHTHIFSQTRTDVTQHVEESNSLREHLQTWTEAGIRAQRQNERNTKTDKNTRGQTRNGKKKWGWV